AASVANSIADARRQLHVMAVAGREIGAGLRDADDRLAALQLLTGQAEVQVTLDIERGQRRIVRIVEPAPAAQPFVGPVMIVGHRWRLRFRPGAKWPRR